MTANRPDRCHYPIFIAGEWLHSCRDRYMQPIEPAQPLRLVERAS